MKKLSIIIPTKEEAECLPPVIKELRDMLGNQIHEIIVVDANSPDGTSQIADQLGCKVLQQQKTGYGNAVSLGLQQAQGELVTFFDADGSYDPKFLLAALPLMEDAKRDAIFCTRYHRDSGSDDDTWIRLLGNWFFTALMRLLFGVKLTDALHLYVVIKRSSALSLSLESEGFDWCLEFPIRLHQSGANYSELPCRERPRIAGETKVNALFDGWKILTSLLRWRLASPCQDKCFSEK
jgi:glycosyltransferase involved in cell wall biosynthesis